MATRPGPARPAGGQAGPDEQAGEVEAAGYPVWRDWLEGTAAHPRPKPGDRENAAAGALGLPGARDGWRPAGTCPRGTPHPGQGHNRPGLPPHVPGAPGGRGCPCPGPEAYCRRQRPGTGARDGGDAGGRDRAGDPGLPRRRAAGGAAGSRRPGPARRPDHPPGHHQPGPGGRGGHARIADPPGRRRRPFAGRAAARPGVPLYRQDDGSLAPAPPAAELHRVLTRAVRP